MADREQRAASQQAAPRSARLVGRLAVLVAHIFYRVDVIGRVPPQGAVILLPNHQNALLDPALVMATAGRPIRFVAKSTLFKGPFAPLVKAAHAIPVYRQQDGVSGRRNEETFADVDAALARGEAVCIFPEGISHSSGRLEPLRSGAARMALSAAASGVYVQLVPVGINLERKTTFRSRATVAFGAPFKVAEGESHPMGRAGAVKALTKQIALHMRALIIEADPVGDAALVERLDRLYSAERPQPDDAQVALLRRKALADAVGRLRAEKPEWYEAALIQLRRYDDRLRRFGLQEAALDWQVTPAVAWRFAAREVPAAFVLVPLAVAATVTFALPYRLTALASKLTNDMDATATAKVLAGGVVYGAWIALLSITTGWLAGSAAALLVAATLPLLAAAGLFAIERETAAWQTARSWLALRGAPTTTREALRRRRAELAGVLDQLQNRL